MKPFLGDSVNNLSVVDVFCLLSSSDVFFALNIGNDMFFFEFRGRGTAVRISGNGLTTYTDNKTRY